MRRARIEVLPATRNAHAADALVVAITATRYADAQRYTTCCRFQIRPQTLRTAVWFTREFECGIAEQQHILLGHKEWKSGTLIRREHEAVQITHVG